MLKFAMWKLLVLMGIATLGYAEDGCKIIATNKQDNTIKVLNLSGQGIKSLKECNFSMYPEVEKIDLSNNDITEVKDNIVSENLNLIGLDLSGNKNIIIPSFSTLIISDSIKQLSLADCNIEELPYLLFDGVQNVESIDISKNPLTEVNTRLLLNLHRLKQITLPASVENQEKEIRDRLNITVIIDKTDPDPKEDSDKEEKGLSEPQPKEATALAKKEYKKNQSLDNSTETESLTHQSSNTTLSPNTNETSLTHQSSNRTLSPNINETSINLSENIATTLNANNTTNNETQSLEPPTQRFDNGTSDNETALADAVPAALASNETANQIFENNNNAASNPETHDGNITNSSNVTTLVEVHNEHQPPPEVMAAATANENAMATPVNESLPTNDETSQQNLQSAPEPPTANVVPNLTRTAVPKDDNRKNAPPQQEVEKMLQQESVQRNLGDSEEPSTEASEAKAESGQSILVILVIGLTVLGAGVFAYKFYTTGNYHVTNTEEPVGRELKEIVTIPHPMNSNGAAVIREEEPLVRSEETTEKHETEGKGGQQVVKENEVKEPENTIFGTTGNSERNHTSS